MRRLFFLALGMFTVGGSSFMIAGLLPEIARTIGQPIPVASQGIAAFSLTYFLSAPLFSVLLANKPAKPTLKLALMVFLFGNVLTLFSENIVLFILGRAVAGLGAGAYNPLCVSIAVQLAGREVQGKTLSLVSGANSAGVVFGVPLGVYLSAKLSWQISIAFVASMALITFIGFSLQKADLRLPPFSSLGDRLRLLADRDVLMVIGVTCFTSLASLGLYSYVAPIRAGAPGSLTVFLFAWGLGGFVGSSSIGWIIDRTRRPSAVMVFLVLGLLLTFLSIPWTKDHPLAGLISAFLWGAFGWATPTPQQHVLFERRESQRAILSGLNSSAVGFGSFLGTAIGGALISSGFKAISLPFFAAAVLGGVAIGQVMLIRMIQARSPVS